MIEEVYGRGNLAALDELVSPEYIARDAAVPGEMYSLHGARELADRYRRAFPELRLTVQDQVAEGDTVVTRWHGTCTNAGKTVGLSPAPAELTLTGMRISRFDGLRIVEEQVQWDTHGLLVQLGVLRPRSKDAPTRLDPARLAAIGALLARAFHDDPMYIYALPNAAHRARVLPAYLTAGATYGHVFGALDLTPGELRGAAVWIGPAGREITPERLAAAGFPAALTALGDEGRARLALAGMHMDELRRRAVPGPHWYLMLIGIEPEAQGQGLGARLLGTGLARADAEGLPCYLETASARNVPFYQRHGFAVVEAGEIPGGFRYWAMRRMPGV
jgi:predicted ester cyclase/GNAT superfamily N-acetyltransferase